MHDRPLRRDPAYLALWSAQLTSSLGDWIGLIALLGLVAFRWEATADRIAGVLIAYSLPLAVVGPAAGVLVDRLPRRAVLIAADVGRAGLVCLFLVCRSPWQVYAVAFALSSLSAFFVPAQAALLPALVGRDRILPAGAGLQIAAQSTKIVGPAIGGVLLSAFGPAACFVIDAATYLVSALLLSTLRPDQDVRPTESYLTQFKEGLSRLIGSADLRFLTAAMAGTLLATSVFNALSTVYVRDHLERDETFFGFVVSMIAIGAIAGAALLAALAARADRLRLVALGVLGLGAGLAALSLDLPVAAVLAFLLGVGVASSAILVPAQVLVVERVGEEVLGRVTSAMNAVGTLAALVGMGAAGWLAARLGLLVLFRVLGGALIAVGSIAFAVQALRPSGQRRRNS